MKKGEKALTVVRKVPLNAGPLLEDLYRWRVTPTPLFYIRNHGTIPAVNPQAYRLVVDGRVKETLSLSLSVLKERFPQTTVTATLQCAGNRRNQLMKIKTIEGELHWGSEAIGNAVWGGVRLRDVLAAAGISDHPDPDLHVALTGLDETEVADGRSPFGGSIPLEKALQTEVLLALEMNGEPLTPEHGFPLRLVVPGYVGARWVKWLWRITLQDGSSGNYFQRRAYRLFWPEVGPNSVAWEKGVELGEGNVTSAICTPADNATLPAGMVAVGGYALSGGGRSIARVEVSADGGKSWQEAELLEGTGRWSWRLWRATFHLLPGEHELVARAVDSAANSQPESPATTWNFKGYVNNAWDRVVVRVK